MGLGRRYVLYVRTSSDVLRANLGDDDDDPLPCHCIHALLFGYVYYSPSQTTTMKLFASLLAFAAAASSASAFTANSAFAPRSAIARPAASTSSLQMVADDAKVILVTGSSRGLGRSIAVELGKQGQKVVVNYAGSEGAAQETVQMIKDAGGDAIAVQANCKLQFVNNHVN